MQAELEIGLERRQPLLGQTIGRVAVADHADLETQPVLRGNEIPHVTEKPAYRSAQNMKNTMHSRSILELRVPQITRRSSLEQYPIIRDRHGRSNHRTKLI
jgi:hypothetical protein